jgi:hypothetical protein
MTGVIAAGLGTVLILAAATKARKLPEFELALVRLVPLSFWYRVRLSSRALACAIAATELAFGALLIGLPSRFAFAISIVAASLCLLFVGIAVLAWRRRVSCGCFPGVSYRAAPTIAVVRALLLLGCATVLLRDVTRGRAEPILSHLTASHVLLALTIPALALASAGLPALLQRLVNAGRHRWRVAYVKPVSGADQPGLTRRRLLMRATSAAVAGFVAGSVLTHPIAQAMGPPSVDDIICTFYWRKCDDCCGGIVAPAYAQCTVCCDDCYEMCLEGAICGSGSCLGCWGISGGQG